MLVTLNVGWIKRSGSTFIAVLIILVFWMSPVSAAERIVVLNPAVSPILQQLEMESAVVGITYNDEVFPGKTRVGSHLRPNIELIKALQPELLIVGSKRAFADEVAKRFDAALFRYDPRDLNEILDGIQNLGTVLNKQILAGKIIDREKGRMAALQKPVKAIRAVFEISQQPLKLAGQQNIVTSIIEAAGGTNLVEADTKHVLLSPEKVLVLSPQLYIYQNGPMNKNPVNPVKRNYFRSLRSQVIEVDQLAFTRPGLNAFEAVQTLNGWFRDLN